ncbi:hypothetical protein [Aliivibrio fischeri]|uniref:hypothetical protein n=1 Tax=Aliivibrio fischeri TaxID=668 RepID=UPI0012DA451B|nr:hypothetical protein [Aliivibrio fischeri]MUJ39703.1 hypothetical protein [Aliivibrio fischeri]
MALGISMSNRLVFVIYKIYYQVKNKLSDFLWGTNNYTVPFVTAICGSVWLFIEPGPEPIVVLLTSLIAVSVSKKNTNDKWYTTTQCDLYIISFRCDTLTKSERLVLAKEFTNKINFLCKYKVLVSEGDSLSKLYLDAVIDNHEDFFAIATKHFVLYYIEKNGVEIFNKYDREATAI